MIGELDGRFCITLERVDREAQEEASLIERAIAGERVAINGLISRYRQRVVRLATHILRRPEEAEDVAQEAFIRAFRNLHTFRGQGRFYTWLYQIVVRICLDRKDLRRWDSELPLENFTAGLADEERPLENVQARIMVESLLEKLSPPMRAMLVLRELEGLEYEEIAQVLQIPVGRVKWRLHTARAQFRELWQKAIQEVEHV